MCIRDRGSVDTPSDATADGGGITLKGATDKTITWANGTDSWDFNQAIKTTAGWVTVRAAEGASANLYLEADEADDNADNWKLVGNIDGTFNIANYSTGSWVTGFSMTGGNDATFTGTVSDAKGNLRTIPQLSKSANHTIVASDAGKHSINSSGGWTFNGSTAFTQGQAITLINNSASDQTITLTSVTLYNSADGTTPTKIAARGLVTVICTATDVYYASGGGLS